MNRRKFIQNSSLAASTLFVPQFLQGMNFGQKYKTRAGKILVVIQFSGGNDGLNTVVPYSNDIYHKLRPKVGLAPKEVLKATDELGFNPQMTGFKKLYDKGLVSVVNSVGYPNPNRSHFRSMDIWQTASGSDKSLATGWLGRYLDSNCAGCETPHHVLEMGDNLSLALRGENRKGFAMDNAYTLGKTTENTFLKEVGQQHQAAGGQTAFLYKTMIDTQSSAEYLAQQNKQQKAGSNYPKGKLSKNLKRIANLILTDTDTRVYYVNHGGFDTHTNQQNKQGGLLKQYSEAVHAFTDDLKANGLLDEVLIVTFSEFGRRVKQNASGGTDHGTANNVFLIGGELKQPGIVNAAPDLANLDKNGDLKYQVDFRSIYANVLDNWLETSSLEVLGGGFKGMRLI